MKYNFRKMVIKPSLKCTANCRGCTCRNEYHKSALKDETVSLDQWKEIIRDGVSLGLKYLTISGGEPTLYPHLLELISEGKKYGLEVKMNSNGSLIDRQYAENLLQAGLDEVLLSIYSHQQKVHDNFRRQKHSWVKVTNAARIFRDLSKIYPKFQLNTMTILLRENFRHLKELIEFHHNLGSHKMNISYLEGDFEKEYLLDEKEIIEFRNNSIPEAVNFCSKINFFIRYIAVKRIQGIYGDDKGNTFDLAKGMYWNKGYCKIPQEFTIILANGDVHPCNMVEYAHGPVMGNVLGKSFKEIWVSEKWDNFRQKLHDKCCLCPMNIHTSIPLKPESLKSLHAEMIFYHLVNYGRKLPLHLMKNVKRMIKFSK